MAQADLEFMASLLPQFPQCWVIDVIHHALLFCFSRPTPAPGPLSLGKGSLLTSCSSFQEDPEFQGSYLFSHFHLEEDSLTSHPCQVIPELPSSPRTQQHRCTPSTEESRIYKYACVVCVCVRACCTCVYILVLLQAVCRCGVRG